MKANRREFLQQSALAAAGLVLGQGANGNREEAGQGLAGKAAPFSLSLFSKHLHWLDYDRMAETAAELGFDGLDLTVRPGGHVLPERVTEDLPRAVAAIRKAGLQVPMITTAILSADEPQTDAVLRTASEAGIPAYRLGWYPYDPGKSIRENWSGIRSKLKGLQRLNRRYRIHGNYQNHAGSGFGSAVLDLWTVIREFDPEWIGCQYDIRHAVAEGAHSWPIGLELLKGHIRTINLKDFQWALKEGHWKAESVPLGLGMVPFKAYFSALRKHGISCPVSLHYEYPLGGANQCARQLAIAPEEVLKALRRDLQTARNGLKEA